MISFLLPYITPSYLPHNRPPLPVSRSHSLFFMSACHQYSEDRPSWVHISNEAKCFLSACGFCLQSLLPGRDIAFGAGSTKNTNSSPPLCFFFFSLHFRSVYLSPPPTLQKVLIPRNEPSVKFAG